MRTLKAPTAHTVIKLAGQADRLRMMLAECPDSPDPLIALRRIRVQAEELARSADRAIMLAVCDLQEPSAAL